MFVALLLGKETAALIGRIPAIRNDVNMLNDSFFHCMREALKTSLRFVNRGIPKRPWVFTKGTR
jgi:hypothetical protein